MKKYFIASGVAVVAFAMAAFAASLNVDGGTIQSGTDNDLKCTDNVEVVAWGVDKGKSAGVRLDAGTLSGCADSVQLHVYALDGNGTPIARSISHTVANAGSTLKWETFGQGPMVPIHAIKGFQIVLEGR